MMRHIKDFAFKPLADGWICDESDGNHVSSRAAPADGLRPGFW